MRYHSLVAANLYVEIQSAGEVEATEHIPTWDGTRDQTLDLNHNMVPELNEEQRRQLNDIIAEFNTAFNVKLGKAVGVEMEIKTGE